MKKWYNWPRGYYTKPWKPWYKIAWGLLWLPFMVSSFALFYMFVVICHGIQTAEEVRKEVF